MSREELKKKILRGKKHKGNVILHECLLNHVLQLGPRFAIHFGQKQRWEEEEGWQATHYLPPELPNSEELCQGLGSPYLRDFHPALFPALGPPRPVS